MFLHDWDNPIQVNRYWSSPDLKGIVKPINSYYASDTLCMKSFIVTEDVMAMVVDTSVSHASGSGTSTSSSSSNPYFKVLYKGKTYKTTDDGGWHENLYSYTIYPNVK